jgi:uncharacterized membrane protein YphA (DoxX/SURF4 family)
MHPLFIPAVFITLMFFLSGFEKIYYYKEKVGKFAKKLNFPLTLAQFVIACVILLEIGAPSIIATYMYTGMQSLVPFFKLAIIALVLFTTLATVLYHNPLKGKESYYAFMSNLSTVGGLLALYISA